MKVFENFEEASIIKKQLNHCLFHLNECENLNLKKCKYSLEDGGSFSISTSEVNNLANNVRFMSHYIEIKSNLDSEIHIVNPYYKMQSICLMCPDNMSTIGCYPYRINLFYHCHDSDNYTPSLYTFDYEDYLLSNNFSKDIVGKCHSYILQFLKDHPEIKDLQLNNSIKTMLPFA